MPTLLEISQLGKAFGAQKVLRSLSLEVKQGVFLLLLGANGSGKTTLLRICAGLSRPDEGQLHYAGQPMSAEIRSQISHAGHQLFLYGSLTAQENIELFLQLAGSKLDIESCLKRWGIYEERNRPLSQLSKGKQYRVSLCRAFLGTPRFLFFDEPTSSLDESSTSMLVEQCKAMCQQGGMVMIATHDVQRLLPYATRLAVLQEGRIAADLEVLQKHKPGADLEELKQEIVSFYLARNR